MSERILSDWLSTYLKYTEKTEPPTAYHIWTAVSTIAATLQRRTFMRWGHEKIFPNMYIMLVGPSGRCRKGTAMNMGKDLLKHVQNVAMVSESVTREALIQFMKASISNFTETDGKIRFQCAVTCFSPELSVFLGQGDIKFLSNLTDWFDSSDEWTYQTKHEGTDKIQGVCFNMLGATAPDWLQSMLPQEALGGGFTSRCIFIVQENKKQTVAIPILTDEQRRIRKALIHDLEQIALITGEYTFDRAALKAYTKWYTAHEKAMESGNPPVSDPRFAGYCDRRATHVKKLSIIIAASKRDSLKVTEPDFVQATKMLKAAEPMMNKTFGGLGRARYSEITQIIIEYIAQRKQVLRSDLLKIFYLDVDPATLKIVEEVMEQMKIVKIERQPGTGEVVYRFQRD